MFPIFCLPLQIFLSLCFLSTEREHGCFMVSDHPIIPSLLLLLGLPYCLVSCVPGCRPRTLIVVLGRLSVGIIWGLGSPERILVSCVGCLWTLLLIVSALLVLRGEESWSTTCIGVSPLFSPQPAVTCFPTPPPMLPSIPRETAWLPSAESFFKKKKLNTSCLIVVKYTQHKSYHPVFFVVEV